MSNNTNTQPVGVVYGWGRNSHGQLGNGTAGHSSSPILSRDFEALGVVAVAAGVSHSVAIDEFGAVWTVGRGTEGQLGTGKRMHSNVPCKVTHLLDQHRCVFAACGNGSTAVITEDGKVFEWGLMHNTPAERNNRDPNAENPSMEMHGLRRLHSARPVSARLEKLLRDSTIQYLACDRDLNANNEDDHDDYMDEDSPSSGDEAAAQRDLMERGVRSVRTRRTVVTQPVLCAELEHVHIVSVVYGYGHTLALGDNGVVYAKGYNDRGQLGVGSRMNLVQFAPVDFSHCPESVDGGAPLSRFIVKIESGISHCLCLADDGTLYCFGTNSLGQLGLGTKSKGRGDQMKPRLNEAVLSEIGPVKDIACGANHCVAIGMDGRVFFWGHAEYGQHGLSIFQGQDRVFSGNHFYTPRPLDFFADNDVKLVRVLSRSLSTIGLDDKGNLWSWGWNSHGVLGHGHSGMGQSPRIVDSLADQQVVDVALGNDYVLVKVTPHTSRFALSYLPLSLQSPVDGSWVQELGEHFDVDVISRHFTYKPLLEPVENNQEAKAKNRPFYRPPKPIHGHRFVLFSRCPELRNCRQMVVKPTWKASSNAAAAANSVEGSASANQHGREPGRLTIVLPGAQEPLVIKAFVQYLYCDQITSCPPHRLKELAALAETMGLAHLRDLCLRTRFFARASLFLEAADIPAEVPTVSPSTFSRDMLTAVDNGEFADVMFVVSEDGPQSEDVVVGLVDSMVDSMESMQMVDNNTQEKTKTIAAHKALMTQFPFFMKLLHSGFAESVKSQQGDPVRLHAANWDTMKRLLVWVYTGDRSVIDGDSVLELLNVARCFGIDRLVSCCERYLLDEVDVSSAEELLDFAMEMNVPRLEYQCRCLLQNQDRCEA